MCSEVALDVRPVPWGNLDTIAHIVAGTVHFKPLTRQEPDDFREKVRQLVQKEYEDLHPPAEVKGFREKADLFLATREAKNYLQRRYRELGIEIVTPLYGLHSNDNSLRPNGHAQARARLFTFSKGSFPGEKYSWRDPSHVSLLVHEMVHAVGYVADKNQVLKQVQSGWFIIQPKTRARSFQIFEEGIAAMTQRRYLRTKGLDINDQAGRISISRYTYKRGEGVSDDTQTWKDIQGEFDFSPEEFDELVGICEVVFPDKTEKCNRSFKIRGDPGEPKIIAYVNSEELSVSGMTRRRHYGNIVSGLEKLASELYPGFTMEGSHKLFEDDLLRAQVTGDLSSVARRIEETLGPGSLRFLAHIQVNNNIDNFLFALFTSCGTITDRQKRMELRQQIINLHKPCWNYRVDRYLTYT